MNNNKNISLIGIIVTLLIFFSSCKWELDLSKLPPETQTGENTLGCCVDGQRFIGPHFPGFPSLKTIKSVQYIEDKDSLSIYIFGVFENDENGSISIDVSSSKMGVPLKIDEATFVYHSRSGLVRPTFLAKNSGELVITKMDTVNKIVSGQFRVVCKSVYNTDSIRIGNGRFDLTYEKIVKY